MILINKGEEKKVFFNLTPTIDPVYYLFEFTSNDTGNSTYMMSEDISIDSSAYNAFTFSEGSTATYSGGFTLNPGSYDYTIYQTQYQNNLSTASASGFIEVGLMKVIDTDDDGGYDPSADDYIYYDEDQGPSVYGITGPAGRDGYSAGKSYYFNESENSDVIGYKLLSLTASGSPEESIFTTLSGGTNNIFISSYITDELGFDTIPGGIQRFSFYFLKEAANDNVTIHIELNLSDASGNIIGPTLTSSQHNVDWIDASTPDEVNIDLVLSTTNINTTDRMIVRIYANNLTSSPVDLIYYTEGISHYSFVNTSVGETFTIQELLAEVPSYADNTAALVDLNIGDSYYNSTENNYKRVI